MARRIDQYTPEMPSHEWQAIRSFVIAAVIAGHPDTPYAAKTLLNSAAAHVRWCWVVAGLPLDRSILFDRWTIEEFIEQGCPQWKPATRGNVRAQLFRMAEALLGHDANTPRTKPLPASEPMAPYSPSEMVTLRNWCDGQSTPTKRRDALALLALSAGAGLATEDIAPLRTRDIAPDGDGVLVVVTGRRERIVPVLALWEPALLAVIGDAEPDDYVFRRGRTTQQVNFLTSFIHQCSRVRPSVSSQRLRATWIVHHLANGTPAKALVEAAGVKSLDALTRFLPFVPDIDPVEARKLLRGQFNR